MRAIRRRIWPALLAVRATVLAPLLAPHCRCGDSGLTPAQCYDWCAAMRRSAACIAPLLVWQCALRHCVAAAARNVAALLLVHIHVRTRVMLETMRARQQQLARCARRYAARSRWGFAFGATFDALNGLDDDTCHQQACPGVMYQSSASIAPWLVLHAWGLALALRLWSEQNSYSANDHHVLFAALAFNTVFYVYLRLSDPGYVPKSNASEGAGAPAPLHQQPGDSAVLHRRGAASNGAVEEEAKEARDAETGGLLEAAQWCAVCAVAPPIGTRHCRRCGRCVLDYDHHCEWLGTCVGRRNKSAFCVFLASQTALIATAVHVCVSGFRLAPNGHWGAQQTAIIVSLALYTILLILVGVLCAFHWVLWASGQTTWGLLGRGNRAPEGCLAVSLFSKVASRLVTPVLRRSCGCIGCAGGAVTEADVAAAAAALCDNRYYSCF